MKIAGKEVSGPAEEILVLPRLDGDIVIRCQAVLDMTPFEAQCPQPKAKPVLVAGGFKPNENDPNYKLQVAQHASMRFAYIALESLKPSNIEWDTVESGNPATWANWEKDLRNAGFSQVEINHITVCIMQANALDEEKLEAARASFLRGMEAPAEKSSGPRPAPPNTPSGEAAKE
jgi:hypothetical protein